MCRVREASGKVTSKPKPEQYIWIGQMSSLCIWWWLGVGVGVFEIMEEETNANAQR